MAPTDDELIKFVSRLQDLRRRSGNPSLSQLSNLTAQVASRIPKSTLHEKLRADSVPDWEFVSAFVHACVIFSRSKNIALAAADTDRDIWRAEHRRMLQAVAAARPAQRKARAAHQELSSPGRYGRLDAIQRQLPADVMTFTGRQEELHLLDQILLGLGTAANTSTVAVVSGPAGVGKTALAVHWSRTAAPRFPDGQLYVDLRGYDPDRPTAPTEALAVMLRSLGLPGAQLGADTDERAAQFRSAISDRQVLLVLDNAKDTDHVRLLLPGSALCRTLVTSRDQLTGLVARSGAERVELKPFSLEQSVSLLDALMGRQNAGRPRSDAEPGTCLRWLAPCPESGRRTGGASRGHEFARARPRAVRRQPPA